MIKVEKNNKKRKISSSGERECKIRINIFLQVPIAKILFLSVSETQAHN